MPAGSGVDLSRPWVAWSDESGKRHESNIDNLLALQRCINDAWHNYSWPRRYVMGIDPATHFTFDERKPVGLRKTHEYTDQDGDKVTASHAVPEYATACLTVDDSCDHAVAYVSKADSVPLALNVLGYDRPAAFGGLDVELDNGYVANGIHIASQGQRDRLLATTAAYLKSIDAYDQREIEQKAKEAEVAKREAEGEAAAKREAEYAKHKQESFDRAKKNYADAIAAQLTEGISAESAAKVQAALSAYETARRKLEGLPN